MIEGKDWIFVFNPRTAGRSLCAAMNDPHFMSCYHNHDELLRTDKRVYAMIRNPVDWLWSFYLDGWPATKAFDEWNETPISLMPDWAEPYRLNIYADVVDEYFLLEEGLEAVFEHFNLPIRHSIPVLGRKQINFSPLHEHPSMREKYSADFDLWESLSEKGN